MEGAGRSKRDWSGKRDSNPRPRPWQGRALPLSYSRATAVDLITISAGARSQDVGGVLRRHRVDEKAAAPLEAGDTRELGNDLQMPVERLEVALAKGRRVQHEVERWIAQDVIHAAQELAEDFGEPAQFLLGRILERRPVAHGEEPRLEREPGREGRQRHESLGLEDEPEAAAALLPQ